MRFNTNSKGYSTTMSKKKASKKKRTNLLTDQFRQVLDDCGISRYRISKETGISQTALALFYNGHRGLSMKAMNTLGEFLKLKIVMGRKPGQ